MWKAMWGKDGTDGKIMDKGDQLQLSLGPRCVLC